MMHEIYYVCNVHRVGTRADTSEASILFFSSALFTMMFETTQASPINHKQRSEDRNDEKTGESNVS